MMHMARGMLNNEIKTVFLFIENNDADFLWFKHAFINGFTLLEHLKVSANTAIWRAILLPAFSKPATGQPRWATLPIAPYSNATSGTQDK
jgi:hypothetical protein